MNNPSLDVLLQEFESPHCAVNLVVAELGDKTLVLRGKAQVMIPGDKPSAKTLHLSGSCNTHEDAAKRVEDWMNQITQQLREIK